MSKLKLIFNRIIPFILIGVFIARIMCYVPTISLDLHIGRSNIGAGNTFTFVLSHFLIWFEYTAIYIVLLKPFFGKVKVLDSLAKFVSLPIFLLNLIFVRYICYYLSHVNGISVLLILYIVEAVLGLSLSIYNLIEAIKEKTLKISGKEVGIMFGILALMLIPSLPSYFMQNVFGHVTNTFDMKHLSPVHRIFLYLLVAWPVALYFWLRNKDEDTRRFALIYIAVATMVGFNVNINYTTLATPWSLPFHLCNTAMYIIPICLIFRTKKLFYFTYFINVFGALLAMCMPNYDWNINVLSMRVFNFWYNHWCACAMPILCVALKVFERPKIKQFYYSMVGFLVYFIIVLFLNTYFTAYFNNTLIDGVSMTELGYSVDFFFINSNYIADSINATWATRMFNMSASLNIGGYTLTFHPLYQLVFFLTYVLLGLCVWFVYSECYIIADKHYALHIKLKEQKAYDKKIKSLKKEDSHMDTTDLEAKMELINFSKKYATSEVYAVENASLCINAGEIFGFLGPNGAGKSTIIKSVVGIQPITEGNIEICGFDVKDNPVEAKYNIGYVPDHYALYEKLTGREYINYIADIYEVSKEDRDERIERFINIFQLEASIDSPIKTYSHGMKQKITIMAALVHNPKVWILDEPLTGLDPNSIYQVKECMRLHAAQGNIVFFSSHIIDVVERLCGRIAIIKHGHIECVKTIEEIEASGKTLEQFYLDIIGDN